MTLGALALAALCVRLGLWQWHRMDDKKAEQAAIERHVSAAAVPIESVVRTGRPVPESREWTRVRATGRFDPGREVTVKFTTREGRSGADVVTPFVLADGTGVLVNRGWMPTENTNVRPTGIPAPPDGQLMIEGWLRPDNQADLNAVTPVDGQVRAISSRALTAHVGRELLPGFVNLQEPTTAGLDPEPEPRVGHWLNFFYALQWWFFAGLAAVGPFWFGRPHPQVADQAKAMRSA